LTFKISQFPSTGHILDRRKKKTSKESCFRNKIPFASSRSVRVCTRKHSRSDEQLRSQEEHDFSNSRDSNRKDANDNRDADYNRDAKNDRDANKNRDVFNDGKYAR
jgi:hypothetical protein